MEIKKAQRDAIGSLDLSPDQWRMIHDIAGWNHVSPYEAIGLAIEIAHATERKKNAPVQAEGSKC